MKITHLLLALFALAIGTASLASGQENLLLQHVHAGYGTVATDQHLMGIPSWRYYELQTSGVAFCFSNDTAGQCPCGNSVTADWGRGGCPAQGERNPRLEVQGQTRFGAGGGDFARFLADFVGDGPVFLLQADTATLQGRPFGNGLLCLGGSMRRVATTMAYNGFAMVPPAPGFDLAARFGVTGPGWRYYQVAYRMPAGFCNPAAVGFTNAVAVLWR